MMEATYADGKVDITVARHTVIKKKYILDNIDETQTDKTTDRKTKSIGKRGR